MGRASDKEVRTELKTRLPKYMMPDGYRVMPELPQTGNGKIDRQKLKQELSL